MCSRHIVLLCTYVYCIHNIIIIICTTCILKTCIETAFEKSLLKQKTAYARVQYILSLPFWHHNIRILYNAFEGLTAASYDGH